jgi:hypothetical protein
MCDIEGGSMRVLAYISVFLVFWCEAHSQTLDQQERCAQQARRAFQEIQAEAKITSKQWGSQEISSDHQSHYNTKSGKCLMLVETTTSHTGGETSMSAYLMDANERRQYASYLWISRKGKKYWEVPPTSCELTPSLKEKKLCRSREEFDEFVAGYME